MNKIYLPVTILMIVFLLGCSSGGGNPIMPVEPPLREYISDNDGTGHELWAYVNISYDRESGEFIVRENRQASAHFNVKSQILPPNCSNCISINLIDVDPFLDTYTFRVKLKNPTTLEGHDVRGIVMLDPAKNHQLLNADGYTSLYDDDLEPLMNPFKAYATGFPQRVFESLSSHKADFELYIPNGDFNIDYAVDASWPGNCKEPYEIIPPALAPTFDTTGQKQVSIDITVHDWQVDVDQVWVDASTMGFTGLIQAAYIDPETFRATFNNLHLMPQGEYQLFLHAKSAVNPLWMYQTMTAIVQYEDPPEPDRLATVLAKMGKTKSTLKYSGSDLNWFVPDMIGEWQTQWSTRLGYYDDTHRNILTYPVWAETITDNLRDNYNSFETLLKEISTVLDASTDAILFYYNPTGTPLLDALIGLHDELGSPLSGADQTTISNDAADVPIEVQIMVAKILGGMEMGYDHRQAAIAGYSPDMLDILWNECANPLTGDPVFYGLLYEMCDYDFSNQYQAGAWIAAALDDIRIDVTSYIPPGDFDFSWTTPLGEVLIDGTGASNYSGQEYCLIFDCDGDDTYGANVAGNASWDNAFSVCVDVNGNDTYDIGSGANGLGSGRHGTAVLWDLHGTDSYDGFQQCQGLGIFGVGILCDSEGSDTYNIERIGQATGMYGIGLLIDEAGNDTYDTYTFSQGFGYVSGYGALIDMAGDDVYQANVTDIIYPAIQDPAHNFSMSQGAAFGFRADEAWIFLSGGVGALIDGDGADYYETDVMGTAFAYWFSSGMIADYGSSNDEYRGYWYNVAGTAHYGSSIIFEYGGDDYYKCVASVGVGGAHDFSISFLLDYFGDDTYDGSYYTLGGALECATGFCVDWNGTDIYTADSEPSLGGGLYSTGRSRDSWGIFLDMGGTVDTYNDASWPADNDVTWSKGETGAGGDFEDGDCVWID